MKREYLESFIGKKVKVIMFDNEVIKGKIQAGNGFFYEAKWYVIENHCFRLSHIKKIKEVNTWEE